MSIRALAAGILMTAAYACAAAQAGQPISIPAKMLPLPIDADALIRIFDHPSPVPLEPVELFNGRPIKRQTLSATPLRPSDGAMEAPSAASARWPDPVFAARHACVKIFTPTWHGTGFFVTPDGYILTCYHVLAGVDVVTVAMPGGPRFQATDVAAFSRVHDLALLKVDATNVPFIRPSESVPDNMAEPLYAIGHPGQQSWQVRVGRQSERGLLNANPLLAFSIRVGPGSSGGPVIDGAGRLRAIAAYTATERDGRCVSLGIAPDPVPALLARASTSTMPISRLADIERRIATLDRAWNCLILADHLMAREGGPPRPSAALSNETRLQLLVLAAYAARQLHADEPGPLADGINQLRGALDAFIAGPFAPTDPATTPEAHFSAAAARLQAEFRALERHRTHPQAFSRLGDIERRYVHRRIATAG